MGAHNALKATSPASMGHDVGEGSCQSNGCVGKVEHHKLGSVGRNNHGEDQYHLTNL